MRALIIATRTNINRLLTAIICLLAAGIITTAQITPAAMAAQRLLVVVNDLPISNYDVRQRVKLNNLMGYARGNSAKQKKDALQDLIDDEVLKVELKKRKINISEKQIDEHINSMAKGSGGLSKLKTMLKKNSINYSALRTQVAGSIRMRILMNQKKVSVKVDEKAVDRQYAKITSDPRLRPVTIYKIREIELPVEKTSAAMQDQLLYARAIEAQQIMQRYKGCKSLRRAVSGIYNVKIRKMIEADARKLPKQMRRAITKAGTRKLIGPSRSRTGIQLIAFCGSRKISPPKPPRAAIKNMLANEKYRTVTDQLMRDLRRRVYVDYKDKSLLN